MPRRRTEPERGEESRRLKNLREALRLSQRDLAREFKVASGAVAQWESGEHTIPGPVLKLIELYEKDIGLGGDSQSPAPEFDDAALRPPPVSGFFPRGTIARGASSVVASMLWLFARRLKSTHSVGRRAREIALEQFVRSASKLKGISMKMGQMAAYMDFLLDDADRAILAAIQVTSPAMPPSAVLDIFLRELGRYPRELFAEWSPQPFAAASIGQVHDARLHSGDRVAVKIQYPRMVDILKSDLNQLWLLDQLNALVWRGQKRGVIFEEWSTRFLEECDYVKEAANLKEFTRLFEDSPSIHFPKVIDKLSTRTILTTSFAEGLPMRSVVNRSQKERDAAGETIWTFFQTSFFRHGIFNTDPNPDNFIFGASGNVTFLDFGRVKRVRPTYLAHFKRQVRAIIERDMVTFKEIAIATGAAPDPTAFDFEYAYRELLSFNRPFLCDGAFEFTPAHLAQAFRLWTQNNPNVPFTNYDVDVVFIHQFYFGVGAVLTRLNAKVSCRKIMLDLLYEKDEKRPDAFTPNELSMFGLA